MALFASPLACAVPRNPDLHPETIRSYKLFACFRRQRLRWSSWVLALARPLFDIVCTCPSGCGSSMPSRDHGVLFLLKPSRGFFLMMSMGLGIVFLPILAAMVGGMIDWDISQPGLLPEQIYILSAVMLLSIVFLWWRGLSSAWRTLFAQGTTNCLSAQGTTNCCWWVIRPIVATCLIIVVFLLWYLVSFLGSREVCLVGLALLPLLLLWGYTQDLQAHLAPFSGKRKWFDGNPRFADFRNIRDYNRFLPYPAIVMFLSAYVSAFAWGASRVDCDFQDFYQKADIFWIVGVVVSSIMMILLLYLLNWRCNQDPWKLDWLDRGWVSEDMPMWERRILWAATQEQDGVHSLAGWGRQDRSLRIFHSAVSKVFFKLDPVWSVGAKDDSDPDLARRLPVKQIWRLLIHLYGPVTAPLIVLIVLPVLVSCCAADWPVAFLKVPVILSVIAWAGFALSYHLYLWVFQLVGLIRYIKDMSMRTIDEMALNSLGLWWLFLSNSKTVIVSSGLLTVVIPAYAAWLSIILGD